MYSTQSVSSGIRIYIIVSDTVVETIFDALFNLKWTKQDCTIIVVDTILNIVFNQV